MMNKFIFYIVFFSYSAIARAQDFRLTNAVNSHFKQVQNTYDSILIFKNVINRKPSIDNDSIVEHIYLSLFKSIEGRVRIENVDSVLLARIVADSINKEIDSLKRFMLLIPGLDTLKSEHERRLIDVSFDSIRYYSLPNKYILELVHTYNENVREVGHMMGWVIQKAIVDDPDYVTPMSFARLTRAMNELNQSRQLILTEVLRLKPIYDTIISNQEIIRKIDRNTQFTKEHLFDFHKKFRWYAMVEAQSIQAFGGGIYVMPFNKIGIDVGCTALWQTENGGGFLIHPMLGTGQGIFHFAIGSIYNSQNKEWEMTGNVFVINTKILGGIGFGADKLMINIGYRISK